MLKFTRNLTALGWARTWGAGLLVLAAIAPVWGQPNAPVRGGALTALVQPEPTLLTSAFNTNNPTLVVSANLFDGLLSYDENQKPQPSLAVRWSVGADLRSIRFDLRRGVKWHDGRDFTSADVKFSALEVWKPLHGRGRSTFAALETVETPDANTAVFRFSSPVPAVLSALSAVEAQVLPRHLYEGTDVQKNPHNLKPVGTGPFRFKEWKRGQYIELERNPDYWDSGKPYLDRVVFRVIPDAAARAAAFERGDVAYGVNTPVPLADIQRLAALPQLVVERRGYGWASNYLLTELNLRNPLLKDLRVRQAIAHAIDRQSLINTAWYGHGKVAVSPIGSSLPQFHTSDVKTYSHDPAAANRLLDEAGYPRKEGGVRFTLKGTYLPFGEAYSASAEYLRQVLKRVGIDLQLVNQDLATYVRTVYTDYDFDLNLVQLAAFTDPQIGVHRTFWSKAAAKGVPYVNASGYASAEMDAAIEASRVETNVAKRRAQFHAQQQIVARDLPVITLVELEQFTLHGSRVKGVSTNFDGQLSSLKNVWLEPAP